MVKLLVVTGIGIIIGLLVAEEFLYWHGLFYFYRIGRKKVDELCEKFDEMTAKTMEELHYEDKK